MKLFALNLLVALSWALVTGELSVVSLLSGFAVGFVVLWLLEPVHGDRDYHRRPVRIIGFAGWYLLELVRSSLRVARAVLSPVKTLRDGWLVVPLRMERDGDIALFSNLITLTPGTLTVDVSEDRRTLFVHALLSERDDVDAIEREIADDLQSRVLTLLGRSGAAL